MPELKKPAFREIDVLCIQNYYTISHFGKKDDLLHLTVLFGIQCAVFAISHEKNAARFRTAFFSCLPNCDRLVLTA